MGTEYLVTRTVGRYRSDSQDEIEQVIAVIEGEPDWTPARTVIEAYAEANMDPHTSDEHEIKRIDGTVSVDEQELEAEVGADAI